MTRDRFPDEASIVRGVAEKAVSRAVQQIVRSLQTMTDTLSAEDSGLCSIWEEICVQVQGDESISWSAYEEVIESATQVHAAKLTELECAAVWLQTDEGLDWRLSEPERRGPMPVSTDAVARHIVHEGVMPAAGSWSNERIRAYLDRADRRD